MIRIEVRVTSKIQKNDVSQKRVAHEKSLLKLNLLTAWDHTHVRFRVHLVLKANRW